MNETTMNDNLPTTRHACVSEMGAINRACDEILSLPTNAALQAMIAPMQTRWQILSVHLIHLAY